MYCRSLNEKIQEKVQVVGKYTFACSGEIDAVGADKKVTIYNRSNEKLHEHHWNAPVYSIVYAHHSSYVTIGGSDGKFTFIDVDSDWKLLSISPIYIPQSRRV